MKFFLGLDLGTSYFKAGIFDENGKLKGLGRQYVKKEVNDGALCELPVAVFWNTLRASIGEALKEANISSKAIEAVSYSSQANSYILLDNYNKPLTSLILWPDKRAEGINIPDELYKNKTEFLKITGIELGSYLNLGVGKMKWFQNFQPKLWGKVKNIFSISDYLTFMLTGQKISDASTASLTGLVDVVNCNWWEHSLQAFSLNLDFLPTLQRIGSYAGTLSKSGAKLIGLNSDISYFIGGLDHHCAAIGSGLLESNNISESTGTVLACVYYSQQYAPKAKRFIAPGVESKHFFQMSFDTNGAYSLEWYQKKFASEFSITELLEMATEANKGCNGLSAKPCVFKYSGLEGFMNIKSTHSHAHFVRAILESTSDSLAGLLKQVKEPGSLGGIISTGGGARSKLWVKIKADTLNTPFYIPECSETACLGAAMIGAKESGELKSWPDLIGKWVRFNEIVTPDFVRPT